jgi:hypothetical protein
VLRKAQAHPTDDGCLGDAEQQDWRRCGADTATAPEVGASSRTSRNGEHATNRAPVAAAAQIRLGARQARGQVRVQARAGVLTHKPVRAELAATRARLRSQLVAMQQAAASTGALLSAGLPFASVSCIVSAGVVAPAGASAPAAQALGTRLGTKPRHRCCDGHRLDGAGLAADCRLRRGTQFSSAASGTPAGLAAGGLLPHPGADGSELAGAGLVGAGPC